MRVTTFDERLGRLERQNRRLRWALSSLALVGLAAFALGQAVPRPSGPQVEYRVKFSGTFNEQNLTKELNQLAREGWKFTDSEVRSNHLFFVVERPLQTRQRKR